jgi:Alpha/beta hydrolase family
MVRSGGNRPLGMALGLAAALAAVGCASAAHPDGPLPHATGERVALSVPAGPGPAQYNQVWVRKYGPRDAGHVLVLVPGSPSGQGNFDALAPALVGAVPDLEIWTLDRRENGLEDVSGFERGSPDRAFDYYLLQGAVGGRRFAPISDEDAGFVRDWGVNLVFSDLHEVVRLARDGGRRRVILGGHSMGSIQTPTYAVWDFDGEPAYRDLEALVMIDGAPFEAFAKLLAGTGFDKPWQTPEEAQAALQAFEKKSPFGYAGSPLPVPLWLLGILPG